METGTPLARQNGTPTVADIRQQIDRIAASPGFRHSDPIRLVLLYLAEQAIEFPGHNLKEHQIATAALGRSPDFDPKADSSIRVIVTRLRGRLAEYYTHEGIHDAVLADIPKGAYVLSFSYRANGSPTADVPRNTAVDAKPQPRPARWLAAAGILLSVAGASFLLGRASLAPRRPPELAAFWNSFLETGDPLIVFSNPIFQGTPETGMRLLDPAALRVDGTNETFTGTGEVMAAHELTEALLRLGHKVSLKRARLFTWDEAVSHNLIIVGGPAQSAAFLQLPHLENFALKSPKQAPFVGQEAVRDLKIDAARPDAFYVSSRHRDNAIEYAIVALTPGASSDHATLITAGTDTFATQAAAGFVCENGQLRLLLQRLKLKPGQPVPHFEALLKVEVRGGAPLQPVLLTVYRRSS